MKYRKAVKKMKQSKKEKMIQELQMIKEKSVALQSELKKAIVKSGTLCESIAYIASTTNDRGICGIFDLLKDYSNEVYSLLNDNEDSIDETMAFIERISIN